VNHQTGKRQLLFDAKLCHYPIERIHCLLWSAIAPSHMSRLTVGGDRMADRGVAYV